MPRSRDSAPSAPDENAGLSKRERTKAALIRAAAELIGEHGYERTSMEAVAARAGMSRGAIYGNFASRDELFLAVAGHFWRPIAPAFPPDSSFAERMRILGAAVAREAAARRAVAVGAVSFQLYALTHPELQARLAAMNAAIYRAAAADLAASAAPDALPLPPETFVKVAHALIEGLMLTHFLTPELIDEQVIVSAFQALAGTAQSCDDVREEDEA
ncbi:MAG: TetR family transcriptional regulator [Alphaproteobacteria bacterium]|nr:TetR family transcriptional regulator [Alphaproteobacteria bacterium]